MRQKLNKILIDIIMYIFCTLNKTQFNWLGDFIERIFICANHESLVIVEKTKKKLMKNIKISQIIV